MTSSSAPAAPAACWRLPLEALRWAARGDGVLTWSPGMCSPFARTLPGRAAPDIQINATVLSVAEQAADPIAQPARG